MRNNKLSFTNSSGEEIKAILSEPVSGEPAAYALFVHCFTCNKDLSAVYNICLALTNKNIAVLRFDFTGLGESEGEFSDTNFSSNLADIESAYEFLGIKYEYPQIIIGHSLGGAAALATGGKLEEIKAIATIGAPFEPVHVTHHFGGTIEEIKETGKAKVSIGGRPFEIKNQFLNDIEQVDMATIINKMRKPLLVMHSPIDNIVGIENAALIYENAMHPKSFISLDNADHLLSNKSDSQYAGDMISAWARKFIEDNQPEKLTTHLDTVTQTGEDFVTQINTAGHTILADEPIDVGGSNKGPSPYDLLSSALGACTGMTLRMYADLKKWDLKEVTVHLKHEKKYQEDVNNDKKLDHIQREIEIKGDLDETQIARLMEIADKCPVHKTLHENVIIESSRIQK